MANAQVTCIIKPDRYSTHEHITHLGGQGWLWTREEVIESIENGTNIFFVVDPMTNQKSTVGVVKSLGKSPYVRTYADGDWNNNLLSLNQCPVR